MPIAVAVILAAHAPTAAQIARQLARESHRCSGKLTLTGDGVGAVRVGATVAAVRKACHIRSRKLKKGEAPPPEDQFALRVGSAVVQVEAMGGRVWRVIVDDGDLRTLDRLGVGTPLSALMASAPTRAGETEGVVYAATAAHCGMTFALTYRPQRGEDRDNWTPEALHGLPPDTAVDRVLIEGCKAAR